jgi:uncharacterized membrane protein YcaP (DUF421 family)
MENIFFDNWESLARIFVVTILAYVSIVFLLRVSGKRTLAKMNAFDFIVTVALGSCLATVALNKSVPLANGVLAVFLLIFLQFTITWLAVRYKIVKNIVTSKPILLVYKGEVLHGILKKERITIEELYVFARQNGIANFQDVDAVVLETTGDIIIMQNIKVSQAETLQDVKLNGAQS